MTDLFPILVDIARPTILCEDCEKRPAVSGEEYCPNCRDNLAEAAYERQQEAFYGGGEPVTMDEMHRAAWEEKRRLR